ncbi:MAG: 5'-3' exonuclease H3TH domain-containing protein [Acidimicrobiales bacterium]
MIVHLVDGTYELFRQYFGQRRQPREATDGKEVGATWGVVGSVVTMLASGKRHIGVATDHVIESFRNELWPGYKTGAGVAADLLAQFGLLETSLAALGVMVWPMVELEADDALASAASIAAADSRVEQVAIWTPDKDLGQCVLERRVVQFDRRKRTLIDADGVHEKFGVWPASIPDWLALVGDSADGFPGIAGWGKQSAATVLDHFGHIEDIPLDTARWDPQVARKVRAPALAAKLAEDYELALLFRELARLVVEPSLLGSVEELEWHGPTPDFETVCEYLGDPGMFERASALGRGT